MVRIAIERIERAGSLSLAMLLIAACKRPGPGEERAAQTSPASAASSARAWTLDPYGQAMLAPSREAVYRPAELVSHLALSPSAVVADIGAGPGFLTLPLARAVPNGRVIATDIRRPYLDVALARARDAGLDNVSVLLAPRDRSGLDERSIDVAVLAEVVQHLPDAASYLRNLVAALRPGGRIVLVNQSAYRKSDLELCKAASLRVVDDWEPSPQAFVLVLAP